MYKQINKRINNIYIYITYTYIYIIYIIYIIIYIHIIYIISVYITEKVGKIMMRQIPRHLDLDRVENEAEAAAVPAEDKKKDEKKGHRLRWI